jgi:hypothetical protein
MGPIPDRQRDPPAVMKVNGGAAHFTIDAALSARPQVGAAMAKRFIPIALDGAELGMLLSVLQ